MSIPQEDRVRLIDLARRAVEAAVTGQPLPKADNPTGLLAEKRGCFVTLHNGDMLRGCIGTFQPDQPLGQLIIRMAVAAAAEDPRFFADPITPGELPRLSVEVSVLSQLTPTSEPEKLQVGVHGIYIVARGGAGCFLPEVATEMDWSAQEFLDNCCTHKAGLPAGAWRNPQTKVYLFTSEKFQ